MAASVRDEAGRLAYFLADVLRKVSYRWILQLDATVETAKLWRMRHDLWERVGEGVVGALERIECPAAAGRTDSEAVGEETGGTPDNGAQVAGGETDEAL